MNEMARGFTSPAREANLRIKTWYKNGFRCYGLEYTIILKALIIA